MSMEYTAPETKLCAISRKKSYRVQI